MKILPDANHNLSPFSHRGKMQRQIIRERKEFLRLLEKFIGREAVIAQLEEWNK